MLQIGSSKVIREVNYPVRKGHVVFERLVPKGGKHRSPKTTLQVPAIDGGIRLSGILSRDGFSGELCVNKMHGNSEPVSR